MEKPPVNNEFIYGAHDMTNRFYKIMYQSFPFYMRLYGTLCSIERLVRVKSSKNSTSLPSRDQLINQTYGKVATKDDYDENSEVKKFNEVLVINKSSATKFYNNQGNEIIVYYNKNILDLGDKVSYNRFGKTYSFVVTEFQCYEDVIFEYTLLGIKDHVTGFNENKLL
jgi:hypothetical protein